MDLALLRQVRAYENPFNRGSPAMDLVVTELQSYDPERFSGLTKKAVRDRVMLLLDQYMKQENFARKQ